MRLEAVAIRLEAIAIRLEAFASRLEAFAIRPFGPFIVHLQFAPSLGSPTSVLGSMRKSNPTNGPSNTVCG